MSKKPHSSKQRFVAFRKRLDQPIESGETPQLDSGRRSLERTRSFASLLGHFLRFAGKNRRDLFWSLGFLTFGATIGLIPPAATKVVFDNILGDEKLPSNILNVFPSLDNKITLLGFIAIATIILAIISLAFNIVWL